MRRLVFPFVTVILIAGLGPNATTGAADATRAAQQKTTLPQREVDALRGERDLASAKVFYLKLDARHARLSLLLAGVTLQEHAVERIEIAVPRVAFWRRSPPPDWPLKIYRDGRLSPARERDRVEVVAPATSLAGQAAAVEPSPPPVPPAAEDAYSVPARYRILFEPGLALEVVARGGGRNRGPLRRSADALSLRASGFANALSPTPAERVRLRVALRADDAGSLYRALPPGTALVIVGLASD
jgi:hypothetical protein